MLLRNARLTADPVDVLIENGTIRAVSPSGAGRATGEEIDLAGRWVVPGLWDHHVHFSQWALSSRRTNLSSATSAKHAAEIVRDALAAETEPTVPFIGVAFTDGLWPDAPNREVLDEVSGARPVVLVSNDIHCVWLNSAALKEYGHADHPTGLLKEDDAFSIARRIDTVDPKVLDSWADDAAAAAARRGVVGIVDLEMSWNHAVWSRRIDGGSDNLRVEFAIYSEHLDRAIELGLRTGDAVNELLTVGRFKILIDGSLNTRTAYCLDEYPGLAGQEHSRGLLTVRPEQLIPLMRKASAAGIVPTVHAIGDHANTIALDAFEQVGCTGSIEHAQLVAESDFARFARLGVQASVQPDHAMDDRDIAEHYWAGKTGRSFAFRSLLDAGASLLFGSDAPVSPLDPWRTIAAAVMRTTNEREPWHPEQRITVDEALTASTRSTIAAGEPADLVIVDEDPRTASADALKRMPVAATMLGGRFTHSEL